MRKNKERKKETLRKHQDFSWRHATRDSKIDANIREEREEKDELLVLWRVEN